MSEPQSTSDGLPSPAKDSPVIKKEEDVDVTMADIKPELQGPDADDIAIGLLGKKRARGRPPGSGVLKKAKAEDQLSQNPEAVKKRNQKANMGPYELQVHNAKNADRNAKMRAFRELRDTEAYKAASKIQQTVMESHIFEKVMQERNLKQQSTAHKIATLTASLASMGVVELDARRMTYSGFNEVEQATEEGWEDLDDDISGIDADLVESLQGDWTDIAYMYGSLNTTQKIDLAKEIGEQIEHETTTYGELLWKTTLEEWQTRIARTRNIVEDLDTNGPFYRRAIRKGLQPHDIFHPGLRAVLRNQWSRSELPADSGWYHHPVKGADGLWRGFPGPPIACSESYLHKHGFLPNPKLRANYQWAFQTIIDGDPEKPPKDWRRMLPEQIDSLIWNAQESTAGLEWLEGESKNESNDEEMTEAATA